MALRQKIVRSDHVRRSSDEKNVIRGHALFIRFMERKGLGDCVHYFPDTMTLGSLRSTTEHELWTRFGIQDVNDRERIMRIIDESHREDQSDDTEVSNEQSSIGLVMVALCNRETIYIFILFLLLSSSFFSFSSPNLSSRRLDVYHTLAHGVALVRI